MEAYEKEEALHTELSNTMNRVIMEYINILPNNLCFRMHETRVHKRIF